MRQVSVAMIAEHVGRQPAAVRQALKAEKVQVERLPGRLGLRVSEKDANTVIYKRWPDTSGRFQPREYPEVSSRYPRS